MADPEPETPGVSPWSQRLRRPELDPRGVSTSDWTLAEPQWDVRGLLNSRPTLMDRGVADNPARPTAKRPATGATAAARRPRAARRGWPPPKKVPQTAEHSCWAAALESWLGAVNDPVRARTESQLLAMFPGVNDGLDVRTFRNIGASFGMDTKFVERKDFTPEKVGSLLKMSVLFVSYPMEEYVQWWHDVVLYDIAVKSSGAGIYSVMNPSERSSRPRGKGQWWPAGYQKWEEEHFFPVRSKEYVLVGWKARGRPGRLIDE